MNSLQYLPTELLERILDEADAECLYRLAMLSRRLHFLALPIYLSRKGIRDFHQPDCSLTLQCDRMGAIRGIRLALFITSIKRLSFVFSYPAEVLLREITEATRLLQRQNMHIESIQFNFAKLDLWGLGEQLMGNTTHLLPPDKWFEALRGVLDATSASGCERFSVLCGQTYWLRNQEGFAGISLRRRSRIARMIKSIKTSFTKLLERPPSPSSNSAIDSHLDDFELSNSPTFLHPQMREWTLRTLLNSPITSLSIAGLGTTRSEWTALLPRLTLPALSSLRMKDMWIHYDDLTRFLARHPCISSLTLHIMPHHISKHRRSSSASNQPSFPALKQITASIDLITRFLSSPNVAPCLDSVTLLHSTTGTATFCEIDRLLSPLASRLRHITLLLNLKITEPTPQWVSKNIDEQAGHQELAVLSNLRQLELYHEFFYISFSADTVASMPSLLSVFPLLEEIKFPAISWMTAEAAKSFAKSFKEKCPLVRSVSVNGKTYLLSAEL